MKLVNRFAWAVISLLIILVSESSYAQWSTNPAVNNAVCTATNNQDYPTIASDDYGGTIITWEDYRSGTDYDIYAQRINSSGTVQWTTNGVAICTAASDQGYPAIVSDGYGGAIITWYDNRSGNYEIYAQRINSSGVVQWTANGVAVCTVMNTLAHPALVSDGSGGAIITWPDFRNGTDDDIYAQRVNSAGVVQWTANGVPVDTTTGNQDSPTLTSDGSGGAIITWHDYRNGTDYDIYAQRVTSAGSVEWTTNGVAVCTATKYKYGPMIVSDGYEGAIITWFDSRNGTDYDIYAQRINSSGTVQWTTNGVPIDTTTGNQDYPTLTSDGSGGAIITWYDHRSGTSYDIYAQHVNSAGVVQWTTNGVAICTSSGDQISPMIESDGAGGAIIVWADSRSVDENIYAQRISSSGVVEWTTNGVAVCDAAGTQNSPTIVSDGSGGAIITWVDLRSGTGFDIYAQRLDRLGNLYPEPWVTLAGDVSNDQGGKMRVLWNADPLDTYSDTTVTSYTVLMGVKSSGLLGNAKPGGKTPHVEKVADDTLYWQTAATVTANWSTGYNALVATSADSGPQGTPYYYFKVIANTSDRGTFWTSNIDSGYSVDNLPPGDPAGLAGKINSDSILLHWSAVKAPDLWGYQVYRNTSTITDVSSLTPYATTTDTTYTDNSPLTSSQSYYAILARDIHGNLSGESNEISFTPEDFSLSVTLTAFTATEEGNGVALKWKTGSETNNAGFLVMREKDGDASFKEIAGYKTDNALIGLGTSTDGKAYLYTDYSPLAPGKYIYELQNVTTDGKTEVYNQIIVDVTAPTDYALYQNYPNPFNPSTNIRFDLKDQSTVTLDVYNTLGQMVDKWNYGLMDAGRYSELIDMSRHASGIYFYRLSAIGNKGENFESIKKLVLMK